MHNTFYYGEKVAKITAQLTQNTAHRSRIEHVLKHDRMNPDPFCTLCAEAARVLDAIEDLLSDIPINWAKVLNKYSALILNHLLAGEQPDFLDLFVLAQRSVEHARA